MKKQNTKRGFTLVELLVVIAILAILATVSVVGYTAFITRAQESNARSEAAQIRDLIMAQVISGESYELGTKTDNNTTTYYYAVVPVKGTDGKISYQIQKGTTNDDSEITYDDVTYDSTANTIVINVTDSDIAEIASTLTLVIGQDSDEIHYIVEYDNKTITVAIDLADLNGELKLTTTQNS